MACGAFVDGGAAPSGILRDMRCHAQATHLGDDALGRRLVPTQPDAGAARNLLDQSPLRSAVPLAVVVVASTTRPFLFSMRTFAMSHSLKLCLVALLNKPGVTVGRRGVRLNLRFSPWQPRSGAIRDNVPSRVLWEGALWAF